MSEPKTKTVIFSKNRTLQLKSLLRSLRENSDMDDAEIDVIYTTESGIPYESLMSQFACRFVRQGDFLADVSGAIEGSDCSYVLFMVDDLICRDTFSLRRVESLLDRRSDIDCFSLRLGRNIQDGAAPDFESADADDDILVWDTKPSLGRTWRYFWEVSSSLYRRDLVQRYIRRCHPGKINYPNPFESHYYSCMPSHIGGHPVKRLIRGIRSIGVRRPGRMACFERSKCFTQGVNLVAQRNIDYQTLFEPQVLHDKMEEGFVIDYESLREIENTRPNVGSKYFQLVKDA
jgi:hypothetical protein